MSFSASPGKMVICSAPSGAGKTTLVKHLLSSGLPLQFSVSACTRTPRPGEQHGRDYYFLTPSDFRSKIESGDFVEWEEVYPGSYYGTLRSELHRIWASGHHVLFDIDVAGGINLKNQFPVNSLSIFIKAPSIETLRQRLADRNTNEAEDIAQRVAKAEYETSQAPAFDYILINDRLEDAKEEIYQKVKTFLAC